MDLPGAADEPVRAGPHLHARRPSPLRGRRGRPVHGALAELGGTGHHPGLLLRLRDGPRLLQRHRDRHRDPRSRVRLVRVGSCPRGDVHRRGHHLHERRWGPRPDGSLPGLLRVLGRARDLRRAVVRRGDSPRARLPFRADGHRDRDPAGRAQPLAEKQDYNSVVSVDRRDWSPRARRPRARPTRSPRAPACCAPCPA